MTPPVSEIIKRAFDGGLATLGLLVLFPLFIAIALAIRLVKDLSLSRERLTAYSEYARRNLDVCILAQRLGKALLGQESGNDASGTDIASPKLHAAG